MSRNTLAIVLTGSLALVGCADHGDDPTDPADPNAMADRLDEALGNLAEGTVTSNDIEYKIHDLAEVELAGDVTPEACNAVDGRLSEICSELQVSGGAESCYYFTSFFYAHQIPRCAVRFMVFPVGATGLSSIYALDFAGPPIEGSPPSCGNARVDSGEECDDGNLEAWDGCDPTCLSEPFEGCEAVIESFYAEAGLAQVDQTTWVGPRSHLMVNRGTAMTGVDQRSCNAAISLGADVCNELYRQMPFVSWCQPSGELHDAECSIRLEVGFHDLAPETGVFTTGLPGILAFTIR